jgi:hypothetical protein
MKEKQKHIMQVITRLILIIGLCCLAAPASVLADLRQFIPRIYNTEGDLEIEASHENKENVVAGNGTRTSDTFLSEKIVLTVNGFVYHPRFLLFLGKLGTGLSQEKYSQSSAVFNQDSSNNDDVWEYEFRALLLPEHPYNLELYALRYNPFIIGRAYPELSSVTQSEGALFTYKQRPFKFKMNYNISNTESTKSDSDSTNYGAFANYFTENISLAGSILRSVSKTSIGSAETEYKLLNYTIDNQIRLFKRTVYLTSNAGQVLSDQQAVATDTEGNRITWSEQLNMYLPWNFNSIITYGYFRDVQRSQEADTGVKSKTEAMTNTAGVNVTHQLYDSLRTAYNFNYNASLTSTGDAYTTINSINAAYTKKIPWGKLLAGLLLSESDLDRRGNPTATGENYQAEIFGEFSLEESNIDLQTIKVYVKDPVLGPIQLTNNVHYSIFPVGNTFKIFIIDIPAVAKDPNPNFVYTFKVTYLFALGTFDIRKSGFGYNLKLELFDKLVNPYYAYYHENQELLSGTLTSGTDEITSHTVGLVLEKRPYSLLMEYQDYDSRLNPSRRYRAETDYRQNFDTTTYFDARVYYTRVKNLPSFFNPENTTETSTGIDLKINKRYPRQHLTLAALGSYSNRKLIFETNRYALGATLTWSVAKVDLSLGANLYRTESQIDTGDSQTTNQSYYFSLKRKLF